jgi:hypothetical protein
MDELHEFLIVFVKFGKFVAFVIKNSTPNNHVQ